MKSIWLAIVLFSSVTSIAVRAEEIWPLGFRIVNSETREAIGLFCTRLNEDAATKDRLPCGRHQFMNVDDQGRPIASLGTAFELDKSVVHSRVSYRKWLKRTLKQMVRHATPRNDIRGMGFALGTAAGTYYALVPFIADDWAMFTGIAMMFVAVDNPFKFDYTGNARRINRMAQTNLLSANDRENFPIREHDLSPKLFQRLKNVIVRGTRIHVVKTRQAASAE